METTATAGGRKFFLFYDIFANSQNILCALLLALFVVGHFYSLLRGA